jgi:hypothetical protein
MFNVENWLFLYNNYYNGVHKVKSNGLFTHFPTKFYILTKSMFRHKET